MLGLVFDVFSLANDKKINDFLEVNLIWLLLCLLVMNIAKFYSIN
jgi:hypothetical protein